MLERRSNLIQSVKLHPIRTAYCLIRPCRENTGSIFGGVLRCDFGLQIPELQIRLQSQQTNISLFRRLRPTRESSLVLAN